MVLKIDFLNQNNTQIKPNYQSELAEDIFKIALRQAQCDKLQLIKYYYATS